MEVAISAINVSYSSIFRWIFPISMMHVTKWPQQNQFRSTYIRMFAATTQTTAQIILKVHFESIQSRREWLCYARINSLLGSFLSQIYATEISFRLHYFTSKNVVRQSEIVLFTNF